MEHLGDLQRAIRMYVAQKKITIPRLEKAAGLKPGSVYNILNGRSQSPSLELILAITQVLDCRVEDLLHAPENACALNLDLFQEVTVSCFEALKGQEMAPRQFTNIVADVYKLCCEENNGRLDSRLTTRILERAFSCS